MEKSVTEKALIDFRNYVVKESKSNLTRMRKNSSKKLYNSIKGEVKVMPNSISIYFSLGDYGEFIDKGVSGKEKKYNTPFSYKSKRPPSKAFDKWTVKKRIAPRDEKGKFLDRKSLSFLIARSVYKNGIKPSLFFTKPFQKAYSKLPSELIEKYGLEAQSLFDSIITQPVIK